MNKKFKLTIKEYEVFYTPKEKNRVKIIKVDSRSITTWNVIKDGDGFYEVDVRFETGKTILIAFKEKNEVVSAVKKLNSGLKLYFVLCKVGQSDEVHFCNDENFAKLLETLEEE
jgi:hypothetical protein